ncbi:MAG TPA: alkaline phosphatase family protein, partial [Kofleriaceae bacterium]|nr:alkaline phosphatase family protein [Kofleriaceae bacterium]
GKVRRFGDAKIGIGQFFDDCAAGKLPPVVYIDPAFGFNDDHPPVHPILGQELVAAVYTALAKSPQWKNCMLVITYDEHGGFYDHVAPPRAPAPDPIQPGQCADLSNPPASLQPGGGAECSDNLNGDPETSVVVASELCPALAANPTGPYPAQCAKFDQLGVRVPFMAVSPFSRPQYVSHNVGDHTSILAFIETLFAPHDHLTERDRRAYNLLDLFDFAHAPSLATPVSAAAPPLVDCTPPG